MAGACGAWSVCDLWIGHVCQPATTMWNGLGTSAALVDWALPSALEESKWRSGRSCMAQRRRRGGALQQWIVERAGAPSAGLEQARGRLQVCCCNSGVLL